MSGIVQPWRSSPLVSTQRHSIRSGFGAPPHGVGASFPGAASRTPRDPRRRLLPWLAPLALVCHPCAAPPSWGANVHDPPSHQRRVPGRPVRVARAGMRTRDTESAVSAPRVHCPNVRWGHRGTRFHARLPGRVPGKQDVHERGSPEHGQLAGGAERPGLGEAVVPTGWADGCRRVWVWTNNAEYLTCRGWSEASTGINSRLGLNVTADGSFQIRDCQGDRRPSTWSTRFSLSAEGDSGRSR